MRSSSRIPRGPPSTFISVLAHAGPHQISPRHRRTTISDLAQKSGQPYGSRGGIASCAARDGRAQALEDRSLRRRDISPSA